jgi:hypothetical protein
MGICTCTGEDIEIVLFSYYNIYIYFLTNANSVIVMSNLNYFNIIEFMLCFFYPTSINKKILKKNQGSVLDNIMLVHAKDADIYPHHIVNLYANFNRFVDLIC